MKKWMSLYLALFCAFNTTLLATDNIKIKTQFDWAQGAKSTAKIVGGLAGAVSALALFNNHIQKDDKTLNVKNLLDFYLFNEKIALKFKFAAFLCHTPSLVACLYLTAQGVQELVEQIRTPKEQAAEVVTQPQI